ncbi:hypothetical protein AB0P32_26465 [Streptomyces sp. NPDC085995]|uniref:hypothetical protein n=1 Tax=Streptomyces sp. NPDC085995 TaxID=3154861 RepID=UPI0034222C2A
MADAGAGVLGSDDEGVRVCLSDALLVPVADVVDEAHAVSMPVHATAAPNTANRLLIMNPPQMGLILDPGDAHFKRCGTIVIRRSGMAAPCVEPKSIDASARAS